MLVPQALEGVAAVALLHATVKRWFGAGAGLAAGAVFALTPVAALMFRFNNPDALLVLMLVAAAYCLTRAIERAGTRWIVACGAMIGIAFLAKMMQAFLVLPAFALTYLIAAPTSLRRRILQLLAGGAAVLVSAGWWVAAVELWPVGSRPMIDGSSSNSILNLITGYNGLGRIFGSGGAGGGGGSNFSGSTGPLRLFNELMGGQASWLLPAALLALVAGLWARRGAPRTDRKRAALILWGGWLLVTGAIFSFGQGVIHTYYTVALAPAIGALVAIGAAMAWERRSSTAARLLVALAIAASAGWAYVLLNRTPAWEPWLRPLIITAGAIAVIGLLAGPHLGRAGRRVGATAAVIGVLAAMAGPLAYAAQTITTAHTGSIVAAGPARVQTGPGGAGAGGRSHGFAGGPPSGLGGANGTRPSAPSGSSALFGSSKPTGSRAPGGSGSSASSGGGGPASGGAFAGGGGSVQTSSALVAALKSDAGSYRWAAATSGSQSAATLELASGEAVMAIGGFNGQGGNLSLTAFEQYVAKGDIHYWIGSGGNTGGPGGGGSTSSIASWVKAHYKAVTIGGETVYDLTSPTS
jgi:4-amino-4-deoxy-L-arabinose transferase-like glycosyltransferase